MSVRRTLLVAGALGVAHAAALHVAARWSFVAALLSPGPHSALPALVFGLGFLALRLLVYVALPALAAMLVGFHTVDRGLSFSLRRRASPTRKPGPMLSAPAGASEVSDGEPR